MRNQHLLWIKVAEAGREYLVHTYTPDEHNISSLHKLLPFVKFLYSSSLVIQ